MSEEVTIIPEGQNNDAILHFGAAGGVVYQTGFPFMPRQEHKVTAPGAAASQNELREGENNALILYLAAATYVRSQCAYITHLVER